MWRASSTCWVARNVASSSEPCAPTRPLNFVVMRSSATISDDSTKRMSSRWASSMACHCSRSRCRSTANGLHWESSQRRYSVCGSLSWRPSVAPPSALTPPPRRSARGCRSAQPCRKLLQRVGEDVVVGPQATALGFDDAGLAQLLEVVAQGGLGDVEQRHQLADADLAGMLAQDVDELQPHRVAERLGDLRHADRLLAVDIGVDDGLAARLTRCPLLLGHQFQIDSHRYTSID